MVTVREARQRNRFEVLLDDEVVGFVVYHEDGGRIAFPHTEVSPPYEGRGLASQLVRVALDTALETPRLDWRRWSWSSNRGSRSVR